jgi:hypothetical protein
MLEEGDSILRQSTAVPSSVDSEINNECLNQNNPNNFTKYLLP